MKTMSTRRGAILGMDGKRATPLWAIDRAGRVIDFKKQRMTFDETADLVDSMFARRTIDALRAGLDPQDVSRVLDILVKADVISQNEAEAVNNDIDEEENGPRDEMASDATRRLLPNNDRLRQNNGRTISAADQAKFHERYPDAARIGSDPHLERPYGDGDNPRPHDGYDDWHQRMFPHSDRLKA